MKTENLKEMSDEELLKKQKLTSTVTGILAGMLLLLLILATYISLTKGFSALIVIPIALSPTLMMNFKTVKDIKQELKSRGQA
ncbi:redox-active disulfide protein 2 [Sphingobacterium spiritivorum]|uniref:redox-active disulfide protein 2 n=1 Tax=Sphingobacterium TaxID=28453 RepID=UPI00191A1836|nr:MULTISPECIES: redox-active disulfide protein 2 [Sphingobacterium]QQT25231.1 redox-active disulfide protein 2 [Sphingobacterium spiritivorum]